MSPTSAAEGVPLFRLAAIVLRERRLVRLVMAAGLAITLAVALLRPSTYTTSFTFLPQETSEQNGAALASLAGQFGLSLGAGAGAEQSPEFYADLLTTRRLLAPIVTDSVAPDDGARVPLPEFLRIDSDDPATVLDQTLRNLREKVISTSVAKRTTGVVTVNVSTSSARVSLDIAGRLLAALGEYNLLTRQSQAKAERTFTEDRLTASRAALRTAEDELQRFLQANQRGESPALAFQQERLQREVRLREQVVISLAQKYEENRIREVRDTPVITVIEIPTLAARPDKRHRALILVVGAAASFGLALLAAIFTTMWTRAGDGEPDPALTALRDEWGRVRGVAPR